jgi:thiamine transport system ATP-binding protein
LDGVAFRYRDGSTDLAMRFDLAVPQGAIVAIIGPSGAGKSTLLSLIAGFDQPTAGRIRIAGEDVTDIEPARRPVSMLFQDSNLFAHLDVWTNVALGISPRLQLTAQEREAIAAALEKVGLAGYERRLPPQLSGGERQRVALARVLVRRRPVLLLDEPFAALGPKLRREMLGLVVDLNRSSGMTILMVTHQPEDATLAAGLTGFVDAGRIVALRPTAELFAATDLPEVRAYLG